MTTMSINMKETWGGLLRRQSRVLLYPPSDRLGLPRCFSRFAAVVLPARKSSRMDSKRFFSSALRCRPDATPISFWHPPPPTRFRSQGTCSSAALPPSPSSIPRLEQEDRNDVCYKKAVGCCCYTLSFLASFLPGLSSLSPLPPSCSRPSCAPPPPRRLPTSGRA